MQGNSIIIPTADTDELVGIVGDRVIKAGNWSYGVVADTLRTTLAHQVVNELYRILQERIERLKPDGLVELIYLNLETILYNLHSLAKRYQYDCTCFPNRESKLLHEYNAHNRSSLAYKFLMEYVSARPSNGERPIGIGELQYLSSICSLIIEWGYKNDLIKYEIINFEVEVLKSNRIGLHRDEFDLMTKAMDSFQQEQLSYSLEKEESDEDKRENLILELDEAFECERGYTFTLFRDIVIYLINFNEKDDVYVLDEGTLIQRLVTEFEISEKIASKVVNDISLSEREDYLKPPAQYREIDIYPWRFNRGYSFIRRPMIRRKTDLIWGMRAMYNMLSYTTYLVSSGRYKTQETKMRQLMSKLTKRSGERFNSHIYNIISSFDGFDSFLKVCKINKKRIAGEDGNELGDIDVLAIDKVNAIVYSCEVKAFSFARNPYEMYSEFRELCVDEGRKKCFVTKHIARTKWLEEHIADIIGQYKLDDTRVWKVIGVFITKDPIISVNLRPTQMNFISESDLSIETIRKCR